MSPVPAAGTEVGTKLPENVTLVLLGLAVLFIALLLARFELVVPVRISTPATKRSLAGSADTTSPSMEIPAEPGCIVVLSRMIFAGSTTNAWPAIVIVAWEGGAEMENDRAGEMPHAKGRAISARPISLKADAKSMAKSEQYLVSS